MTTRYVWAFVVGLEIAASSPAAAQPYSMRQSGNVVQLEDGGSETSVSVIRSVGRIAFEMKVKGASVLWFPYASATELETSPRLSGIPFLGPWANRLDQQAFYANGKRYAFDMELGNVRGPRPSHGFLAFTPHWQLVEAKSDASAAWATSRLEFYRQSRRG